MKTTVEIPDELFREAKAIAASRGQSLKVFLSEALRDKVVAPRRAQTGWPVLPPKLHQGETSRIQAVIDVEFSRVDARDWK